VGLAIRGAGKIAGHELVADGGSEAAGASLSDAATEDVGDATGDDLGDAADDLGDAAGDDLGDSANDATNDSANDGVNPDAEETGDITNDAADSQGCTTFGCPCGSDGDCLDGLCVEDGNGPICSERCTTTCPAEGFACRPLVIAGAPVSMCVPPHPNLCKPCRDDEECMNALAPDATALCLPAADPGEGHFCASSCALA